MFYFEASAVKATCSFLRKINESFQTILEIQSKYMSQCVFVLVYVGRNNFIHKMGGQKENVCVCVYARARIYDVVGTMKMGTSNWGHHKLNCLIRVWFWF